MGAIYCVTSGGHNRPKAGSFQDCYGGRGPPSPEREPTRQSEPRDKDEEGAPPSVTKEKGVSVQPTVLPEGAGSWAKVVGHKARKMGKKKERVLPPGRVGASDRTPTPPGTNKTRTRRHLSGRSPPPPRRW